jgi:hypothetical protein
MMENGDLSKEKKNMVGVGAFMLRVKYRVPTLASNSYLTNYGQKKVHK